MRLEVLVDQQEPLIFPLNKEKIIIGSGEHCDIVLDADGISRKHVIIHCGQDDFYVVDQGSTNGTYINEERLVPGKRVEFTSFFPVRLGEGVLLTLLSDDEVEDSELSSFNLGSSSTSVPVQEEESTRVIRTSDLQDFSSLSINTHRKKASVRAKKAQAKAPPKKNKKESNFHQVSMLAVALIIGTILYQVNQKEEVASGPELSQVSNQVVTQVVEEKPRPVLVDKGFIRSEEEIARIKKDFKCTSAVEKTICEALNVTEPYGVTQIGLDVFIFVPIEFSEVHLKRLKALYPDGKYPLEAYLAFFLEHYRLPISEELKDYRFHLYFYDNEDNEIGGFSVYPTALNDFKKTASSRIFDDFLWGGQVILEHMKDYFTRHEIKKAPK